MINIHFSSDSSSKIADSSFCKGATPISSSLHSILDAWLSESESQLSDEELSVKASMSGLSSPLLMASLGLHPLLQVQSETKSSSKLNLISLKKITQARILNKPFSMECSLFLFYHLTPYTLPICWGGGGVTQWNFFSTYMYTYIFSEWL